MTFTCIDPVALYGMVMVYLTNQVSCGSNNYFMTQAEFDAYTAFIAAGGTAATGATNLSVLPELTITGATQIAVAVAALWGLAFIFRALSHYLKSSGESQND